MSYLVVAARCLFKAQPWPLCQLQWVQASSVNFVTVTVLSSLRLRLCFLSFFKRALLPSSTRQSTVRSWLWEFCSSKTHSYVRVCAPVLNFIVPRVVYAVLTLNLPTTTIVAQPFNVIKWQLKFNPVT